MKFKFEKIQNGGIKTDGELMKIVGGIGTISNPSDGLLRLISYYGGKEVKPVAAKKRTAKKGGK